MAEAYSGTRGEHFSRLVIRNAIVVDGRGTPAEGPVDIVIEEGRIKELLRVDPVSLGRQTAGFGRPEGDGVLDASGMYVIPGLVDMHAHAAIDAPDDPDGTRTPVWPAHCGPKGMEYSLKLWMAHGVTTLRTTGGAEMQLYEQRRQSEEDPCLPVPRLVILHSWPRNREFTPDQAREQVRKLRDLGADGIKGGCHGELDVLEAICDQARELGMSGGVATHLALSNHIDAVMASNAGVTSIEHTYGIPEAAIPGVQRFPPDYNEMDELARFRQSGFNWLEADRYPERVLDVLDLLIRNKTVWDPTMVVYEANRDLMRARNLEWYKDYAVPSLLRFWSPTPGVHASFHFDWKTSDEITWKKKYAVWMKWLRVFFERGGTIVAGTDPGWLLTLFGFSIVRELELLQEVDLHPVDVIQIATTNSTKAMGLSELAGGIRPGNLADLAVVDGNPLDNFKLVYGLGIERFMEDRVTKVRTGGVKWTIRGGVVFDAQALLQDVRDYVADMKNLE